MQTLARVQGDSALSGVAVIEYAKMLRTWVDLRDADRNLQTQQDRAPRLQTCHRPHGDFCRLHASRRLPQNEVSRLGKVVHMVPLKKRLVHSGDVFDLQAYARHVVDIAQVRIAPFRRYEERDRASDK